MTKPVKSSPYSTWTRPKGWKPLPGPGDTKKPIKKVLKKVNSVNA